MESTDLSRFASKKPASVYLAMREVENAQMCAIVSMEAVCCSDGGAVHTSLLCLPGS